MSVLYLPPEILIVIAAHCDLKTLRRLCLVCKYWKDVVRKRIWRSIEVKNNSKLAKLTELMEGDEELRTYVKLISFDKGNGLFPTPPHIPDQNDLETLISLLSSLSDLSIQVAPIRPPTRSTFRLELPTLTSFTYQLWSNGLPFLKTVLKQADNLTCLDLHISRMNSDYKPLRPSPNLKILKIHNHSKIDIFAATQPLLRFSSLLSLSQLSYYSSTEMIGSVGLLKLIRTNSPNLEQLRLEGSKDESTLQYSMFASSFKKFKILKSIRIMSLVESPQNLLQIIPLTVANLRIEVTPAQLQHLQRNPRPSLNLVELCLSTPAEEDLQDFLESFRFLPNTVKSVFYQSMKQPQLIILKQEWESLRSANSLTKIVIALLRKDNYSELQAVIGSFKKFGINLVIKQRESFPFYVNHSE